METDKAKQLALGRILRLASRPTQKGDIADYERCRKIIMDTVGDEQPYIDHNANWARDHNKGAAGD